MHDELKSRRSELSKQVGTLLARLRKAAGLTQDELSRRLGVSHSQVTRLERGARNADLADLLLWAEVCGVEFRSALELLDQRAEDTPGSEARAALNQAIRGLSERDVVLTLAIVRRLQGEADPA